MSLQGNAAFWQAVAVVGLALLSWSLNHAVAYLRAHGELARVQAHFQKLTNAYAAWRRVLTPLMAQGLPLVESTLLKYVEPIAKETGLPTSVLGEIGLAVYHELVQAAQGQTVSVPTLQDDTTHPNG